MSASRIRSYKVMGARPLLPTYLALLSSSCLAYFFHAGSSLPRVSRRAMRGAFMQGAIPHLTIPNHKNMLVDGNNYFRDVRRRAMQPDTAIAESSTTFLFSLLEKVFDDTARIADDDSSTWEKATYIPKLAEQNGDHFGVAVCTVGGERWERGDTDVRFTLQSSMKPFNYGIALEKLGETVVDKFVGVEKQQPSRRPFNSADLNEDGLPPNPHNNNGAMMVEALLLDEHREAQRAASFSPTKNGTVLSDAKEVLRKSAGGGSMDIGFCGETYQSESDTAEGNRTLARKMKEKSIFPQQLASDPPQAPDWIDDVVETYLQNCSLTVDVKALSVMAATLANGGVCPLTQERVFAPATVQRMLQAMQTSGLYDESGRFFERTGMRLPPGKSGVSGALFFVVPGKFGIASFSPKLNGFGNSGRGMLFMKKALPEEVRGKHFDDFRRLPSEHEHELHGAYDKNTAVNGLEFLRN